MELDYAEAVLAIGAITAGVAAIGAAKLLPAATAVGFKWLKGTIFG